MKSYEKLLSDNKKWVNQQALTDPVFFDKLAAGQSPEFLWIGCADSRAPADRITNTNPGEIFVHRNVANLVVHTDMNMLSVLQYAVEVLKVKHIMVVGHYGCGGVKAAMGQNELGLIDNWVRNIKDVYAENRAEIDSIENEDLRFDRMCELNVVHQVKNLLKTTIVQKAWKNGIQVHIHGWILELKTGTIKQICEVESGDLSMLDPVFHYDIPQMELAN